MICEYLVGMYVCVFVCVVVNVKECEIAANEGRFKLRDLLSVPMQRVLKYHLLLKVRRQLVVVKFAIET